MIFVPFKKLLISNMSYMFHSANENFEQFCGNMNQMTERKIIFDRSKTLKEFETDVRFGEKPILIML